MSGADKRRTAAALVYDPKGGDAAPRVVAKGYGLVAEMIVARARESGLYVHTAPEMVSLLMQVDLDDRIPPALYRAVAELLAWLYALERADLAGGQGAEAGAQGDHGAAADGRAGPPAPPAFPALPPPRR